MDQKQNIIGWGVVGILGGLMFVPDPFFGDWALGKEFLDVGHVVLFGGGAWMLAATSYIRGRGIGHQLLIVVLLTTVLGTATEFGQIWAGRDFDWMDVSRDLSGACSGLCLARFRVGADRASRIMFAVYAVIYGGLGCAPLLLGVVDEYRLARDFPVVATGDSALELRRWDPQLAQIATGSVGGGGEGALVVRFLPGEFPRVGLNRFRGNWQGREVLSFRLFNPSEESLILGFKIYDQHHQDSVRQYSDRFNESIVAKPGWNLYQISLDAVAKAPFERRMDMSKIVSIDWFFMKLEAPTTIAIDHVSVQ